MFKDTITVIKFELDSINTSLGHNGRPNSDYNSLKKRKKILKHIENICADYDDYALDTCLEQINTTDELEEMIEKQLLQKFEMAGTIRQ